MYQILLLPNRGNAAERMVSDTFANCTPLDSSEGFEERQLQYARLGLSAAGLAEQLRKSAELGTPPLSGWDTIGFMEQALSKIEERRQERTRLFHAHPQNFQL